MCLFLPFTVTHMDSVSVKQIPNALLYMFISQLCLLGIGLGLVGLWLLKLNYFLDHISVNAKNLSLTFNFFSGGVKTI